MLEQGGAEDGGAAERRVDLAWGGQPNLWDVGGLPSSLARSGYTLPGRIARGPRRESLSVEGWDAAERWGLRSIVDLRNECEVGRREGDPVAHAPVHVRVHRSPIEDHTDPEFRRLCLPILDSPEYWKHHARLQPSLVLSTLTTIAEAEPGVLVHCSAGRDRTGMV